MNLVMPRFYRSMSGSFQFLADQLTLFKSGGQIFPTALLLTNPRVLDLPPPLHTNFLKDNLTEVVSCVFRNLVTLTEKLNKPDRNDEKLVIVASLPPSELA